jgi:hypothetical protein
MTQRTENPYLTPALRLHRHLMDEYWEENALLGPDHGIRFNYRIGRFVKSYLRALPWGDRLYYLQGQSYWTLANWRLYPVAGDETFRKLAVACSDGMLARQRADGAWDYPNREWKGRTANAEGTWAALGLIKTYQETREERFLAGALAWHRYLEDEIGFEEAAGGLAANYFAHRADPPVPNTTGFVLRFLAELADATGEEAYGRRCQGLLAFMGEAQKPNGEFPYVLSSGTGRSMEHFQCYQYNAFQCLDLMRYHHLTKDEKARALVARVLRFLRGGLAADGHALYECGARRGAVTYHAAALAAAFSEAHLFGIDGYDEAASRAYAYVLSLQRADGSFPHSFGDYGVLSDQRAYPRNEAMILYHLLSAAGPGQTEPRPEKEAAVS